MKYVFLLMIFFTTSSYAQNQERTVLLYNIGLGGITSGIGGIINKPKEISWEKAFIKAFWQGSIGGGVNFTGKKILYLINRNQNAIYAWPAKLLHSAGVSIMENAALCQPFLQNWNIDYGPVRFDFSTNRKRKFKARFLPEVIYAVIRASKNNRLDLSNTIALGNIIFANHKGSFFGTTDDFYLGASYGRAIEYIADITDSTKYSLLAHEIVHQFQYGEYQIFNTWLKPLEKSIKSKTIQTIFSKYVYFDMPYFFVPYYLEGNYNYTNKYKNFFEFEAERFATNKYVHR